jgi:hypothetical protein
VICARSALAGVIWVAIVEAVTVTALLIGSAIFNPLPWYWFSLPTFLAHAGWILAIPAFTAGFGGSLDASQKGCLPLPPFNLRNCGMDSERTLLSALGL